MLIAAGLLVSCENSPADETAQPLITESETGMIVGQEIDLSGIQVEVTEEGLLRIVVSGTVPSPCHQAVFGFEEPDSEGVLVGSAESWLDGDCSEPGPAQPFVETLEIETLPPGDYLARIGGTEAAFTVP